MHFINFCSRKCEVLCDLKCIYVHACEHTTNWSCILPYMEPGSCNFHEALKLPLFGINFHASEELHYAIQNYFCLKRFSLSGIMPQVNSGSCLSRNKVCWEVIWVIGTSPGRYILLLVFAAGICWNRVEVLEFMDLNFIRLKLSSFPLVCLQNVCVNISAHETE